MDQIEKNADDCDPISKLKTKTMKLMKFNDKNNKQE